MLQNETSYYSRIYGSSPQDLYIMALEKEKKRKRGEILMTQSYKMEDAHKLELYLDKHNRTKMLLKSHLKTLHF